MSSEHMFDWTWRLNTAIFGSQGRVPMGIHTTDEAETADFLAGSLAASGVATSLAAGAAELLRDDPHRELNDRLVGALKTVRERFRELAELQPDEALRDFLSARTKASSESELVAQLSTSFDAKTHFDSVDALRRFAEQMRDNLTALLKAPTSEAAEFVEERLGALSDAELRTVQSIRADRLEADVLSAAHSAR